MAPQVEAHLDGCGPCRVESDALKEIDRRLLRLADTRRAVAEQAWRQRVDHRSAPELPGPGSAPNPSQAKTRAKGISESESKAITQLTGPAPAASASVPARRSSPLQWALMAAACLAALLWLILRVKGTAH